EWSKVFFFEAEADILFGQVTVVHTCALPISVSPSTSALVAVAVRVSLVFGLWSLSETVAVGAVLATVTVFDFSVPLRPGASVGRSEERRVGKEASSVLMRS